MEERGFLGNRVKLARVAGEKGGMFSFLGCFVGEWGRDSCVGFVCHFGLLVCQM